MIPPRTSNFEKYATKNPLVQWLIRRYFNVLHQIVLEANPKTILDVGCGEGITAKHILDIHPTTNYTGLDANDGSIDYAKKLVPQANFKCLNLFNTGIDQFGAEMVICLEVVEHINDSHKILSRLAQWSTSKLVISVPWEPYFRTGNLLRGKYVQHFGNHPEHIHQFNKSNLKQLLSRYCNEITITSSFPWLFAICYVEKSIE